MKLGSMGKPLSPYEVIIAERGGSELPPNDEGNIAIKMQPKQTGLFAEDHSADEERNATAFRGDLYFTGDRA